MQDSRKHFFTIPLLLWLFSLGLYSLFLLSFNFTLRMYFEPTIPVPLMDSKTDVLRYSFVSPEDYLAIVSFFPVDQVKNQRAFTGKSLLFRIREAGTDTWLTENAYNAGDVIKTSEFSFGFPEQPDSKGKSYVFEIDFGDNDSTLISNIDIDRAVTRHYFPKSFYVTQPQEAIRLFTKKIISSFQLNSNSLVLLSTLILPISYYLLAILLRFKLVPKISNYFQYTFNLQDLIIWGIIGVESLVINTAIFYLSLAVISGLIIYRLRQSTFDPQFLLVSSLYLYIFSACLYIANTLPISYRLSSWAFILLAIYIIVVAVREKNTYNQ